MHEISILKKIFPSVNIEENVVSVETNYGPVIFTLPPDYPKSLPEVKIGSQEIQNKFEPFLKNIKPGRFVIYPLIYLIYSVAENNVLNNELIDVQEITEEMFLEWKGKRSKIVEKKEDKITGKHYFMKNEE